VNNDLYADSFGFGILIGIGFFVFAIVWHSLVVSRWPPCLMTSVGHDVVVGSFRSLVRHWGHRGGCHMRGGRCLSFRSAWFLLWFLWRFMFSCRLYLLVSCYSLVFWIL